MKYGHWLMKISGTPGFKTGMGLAILFYQKIIAGLPGARSARGTEPHTHGIWSSSFRLVVTWLTERTYIRTYVRVYRLYGWGRGDYQKEGGVSQVCLGKSTSLRTVPTNGKYFFPDNDYVRQVDHIRGYWNPKRKLGVTTHFSEITALQCGEKRWIGIF